MVRVVMVEGEGGIEIIIMMITTMIVIGAVVAAVATIKTTIAADPTLHEDKTDTKHTIITMISKFSNNPFL